MARVSITNLAKIYSGRKGREITAVQDLNLEIADREFIVLVGPPGCGKSTVLRLIAGVEKTSTGDISIDEKTVNEIGPKARDIGMVFQEDALYPQMSVFENLAFGLKLRKYSKSEIKRRVDDVAAVLGIHSLLEQKPKTLSQEQRRRVAIGRAIVRQPKVILLDEPFSGLDGNRRGQLRREMIKLHQRLQVTMICAFANPVEAMTLGDRLVLMNEGVVEQVGSPVALYNEPANLFVAGFFGAPPINLINGTLKAEGEKIRFCESEGGTIDVAFSAEARSATRDFVGKAVILGIRPEDLEATTFNRKESRATGSGFPAVVDLVEPMVAETNLYLETGAHRLVGRSRETLDHREAGHRFQFEMNLNKVHFFDPVSARRIV